MAAKRQEMLTAVFRDRVNAQNAYQSLIGRGYTSNEINVLMSDATRSSYLSEGERGEGKITAGTHATEGMGVGGAIGTAAGATIAAVAAIGTSLIIPGLGVVAGPIAAALAGGGAGAVAGGAIGALVGLGIPESNAKAYHEALRDGGVVIGVVPRNGEDADRIKKDFEEFQGENICYC